MALFQVWHGDEFQNCILVFNWNEYLKYKPFYAIFKKKEKMRGFHLYTLYMRLLQHPSHKTLLRSSAFVNWILIRSYKADCIWSLEKAVQNQGLDLQKNKTKINCHLIVIFFLCGFLKRFCIPTGKLLLLCCFVTHIELP